jgi:murein DD-endopeptidase MepM/ murein hydrolase activator NlpD
MGAATSTDPVAGEAFNSLGIPAVMLDAYVRAAASDVVAGCGLRPGILMGIGRVESGHGRTLAGASISGEGTVHPPIVGPALDGSGGTARIADTDRGRWDGDGTWDRAVGPMQFIPSTWRAWGRDANRDGAADPHNAYDAALGAAAYLCAASPGALDDDANLGRALFAYNRSHAYVAEVMGWIDYYDTFSITAGDDGVTVAANGTYALPVARTLLAPAVLSAPHHDYPAWDVPLAVGTRVHAVAAGMVVATTAGGACGIGVFVAGDDGFEYGYCHGSRVLVAPGERVGAGEAVLLSGDSGNSTGPHLHLQIGAPSGALVCPQPLLQAWFEGVPLSPREAPAEGCSS